MRLPWTLITLTLVFILVGCVPDTGQHLDTINKQHNRTGVPIEITTFEYKTYNEVRRALFKFERSNKQDITTDKSLGWAAWDHYPPYQCNIHIKEPDKLDDEDILTLGHEMAHCLYGSYHK